ncbi:MAG: S-layer homology domain-containing protein, partial [Bacillota bacterium]|nr:S-layer homology domain-containing protein [Bacillota bacterium]
MKRQKKSLLAVAIVMIMVVSSICSVYAAPWKAINAGKQFKDVNMNFWGYKYINALSQKGIINGYSDGSFKPNGKVSRAEFATMLTKTLNLTTTDNTQTFADVAPGSWDFNVVEAAKDYLTGYRTSTGIMYFYGSYNAVREDMAVALVKALKIQVAPNNGALAQVYSDFSQITPSLQDYVYAAYTSGLMTGSDGKFNPQGTLTRAEAAVLLYRALDKTEKVAVGDGSSDSGTKVPVNTSTDATLNSLTVNGTAVTGFAAATYTYSVVLPAGTTVVPVVAAAVSNTNAKTVVTQAASLPGAATVAVTAADGATKLTYTINFTVGTQKDTDATLSAITINAAPLA